MHHNSGKTWIGCGGICKGIWEHPGINQGYFAPTYPQIRDIFYPTVEEVAADWGLNVKINEGNKEVHFYYGRQYRGTTICRSMEKPQTIVGFKIGNALVDELDILPKEKARTAWRKIIARMRYKVDGLRNGIDVTTTPEGFKFVYEQFVKAVREKTELSSLYGLVQASTFDNEKNLPADYIPSLLESYPPELIKAYLRGRFTNLTSGTVYHQFDRQLNNCEEVEQPGEPIYIGMDFNVVVNSSNPPVKDRVNSMNAMFCNANGERRYKVNVKRCPVYAESLEQQVWDDKGEPDKKSGNDHPNDAGGYFIVKQFPIVKPTGRVTSLRI
ncbi:TPA: terminase [Escherichia coli]|nr:terminase [Escherichia coli]